MYRAIITWEDTRERGAGLPHGVATVTVDGTFAEVIQRAERLGRLPETIVVAVSVVRLP